MKKHELLAKVLVTAVVLGSLAFAGVMWVREKLTRGWDVPHAIYATGQLVDACHTYRQRHGSWPPPRGYGARDVVFVRSFENQGTRVDVWHYGHNQFVHLHLQKSSILVLPVHGDPPPPPGSVPVTPPTTATTATTATTNATTATTATATTTRTTTQ